MSAPTSNPTSGGRAPAAGVRFDTPETGATSPGDQGFDALAAWELNPKVALRPEPFGALLYHFGTRKLSFLKNLTVVGIVQSLADHDSAEAALASAGITPAQRPLYVQALTTLADSGMITRRAAWAPSRSIARRIPAGSEWIPSRAGGAKARMPVTPTRKSQASAISTPPP